MENQCKDKRDWVVQIGLRCSELDADGRLAWDDVIYHRVEEKGLDLAQAKRLADGLAKPEGEHFDEYPGYRSEMSRELNRYLEWRQRWKTRVVRGKNARVKSWVRYRLLAAGGHYTKAFFVEVILKEDAVDAEQLVSPQVFYNHDTESVG